MERETRFELATLALARRCSTAELFPLIGWFIFLPFFNGKSQFGSPVFCRGERRISGYPPGFSSIDSIEVYQINVCI